MSGDSAMAWWAWLIAVFLVVELVFVMFGIPAIARRNKRRALDEPSLGTAPSAAAPGTIRGPETGAYEGGTGSLPKVAGNGKIVLTRGSLHFDKLIGKPVDVPISTVRGVRTAKAWNGKLRRGSIFVVVETTAGEAGFYVKDVGGWASAIAAAAQVPIEPPGARPAENSFTASPIPKGLAIVFASVGVLLGSISGISAAVVSHSISGDLRANGTVVGLSSGARTPHPVVEFAEPTGATIRFTSGVGATPGYPVGSRVGVLYNPKNPHDAVIDEYWQIWFLPTLFGILAAPFLLIGVAFGVVTLAGRRRSRAHVQACGLDHPAGDGPQGHPRRQ
jgi:hypothetical protein